jgi:HAD superfamily hydrolase (TIGR01459 family)
MLLGNTRPEMPAPLFINGLCEIASRYDALLCDAWGVIHDGVRLFPGVDEAMTEFRRARGPVLVLTNAPRPSAVIPGQLDRIGLPRAAYDGVVTSGDATRAAIAAMLPKPAFKLGPEKDDGLYDGFDVSFAPLEGAAFIICTGLFDDQSESPADYQDLLERAAARNLPMICANPDIVVRWGGRLVYCAGALAQIYERLGAAVIYGGKPHRPIYDVALKTLSERAGREIERARVLAVGDGLKTDIAGANAQGIDALYIAGEGGVHDGAADDAAIAAALRKEGAHAAYAAKGLVWR